MAKRLDASRCHLIWRYHTGDFVLDGDRWGPSPLPQKGQSLTQIPAHVFCGQTAAWIKMPLGTRHCVNCRPSYPQKKRTPTPTQFLAHVYCRQMDGWMKTPLGTEVDLGPHCTRRGPSSGAGAIRHGGARALPLLELAGHGGAQIEQVGRLGTIPVP